MSILSDFEDRVGGAIEGLFAGAFRSPVQPVEIAKALARAMDDGRMLGVSKVYVPSEYTVALSPEDDDNMMGLLPTLSGELATYLVDHAREHGYALSGRPSVEFIVHDDLRLGRFRVSAELAEEDGGDEEAVEPVDGEWEAAARRAAAPAPAPVPPADLGPVPPGPAVDKGIPGMHTLSVGETGHDVVLRGDVLTIGRLASSDLVLDDANVSRQHAEMQRRGDEWIISDLGSTNGTTVNGHEIDRQVLSDGDVIEIGVTRLVYHTPRPRRETL